MVRRMTIETANSIRSMGRALEVCVFLARRVAGQAASAGILHAEILETYDLRNIAATLDMC
jgi:hypothetical protein